MKINEIVSESKAIKENDPHGTDDVDWSEVKSAVMSAAKEIHGNVDKSKVDGIMKNLYKHKPNDTENAIQIGTDMLRAKNESVIKESRTDIAEVGRAMMDMAVKHKDDEVSNDLSALGNTLTRFGTTLGPKSLDDVVSETGLDENTIQQYLKAAQQYLKAHGPVRSGTNKPEDDSKDDY